MSVRGTQKKMNPGGHFALGVTADIGAVIAVQPIDTMFTYKMSGKGWPPLNRLFHGTLANCSGAIAQGGVPFLVNALIKKKLSKDKPLSEGVKLSVGVGTGLISSFLNAPCERLAKLHQLLGGGCLRHC